MIIIKSFIALIWSVIGLVVWIPILFRIMFIYIFKISIITITERDLDETEHLKLLVTTGSIYKRGFEMIFAKDYNGKTNHPKDDAIVERNYWFELFCAIIFWSTLILPIILKL
jgi:hypothetical protein